MAGSKPAEKRTRMERRQDDLGPPAGMEERRIRPDRRHPEVEEVHIDDHIEIHGVLAPNEERSAAATW
jgi:hypothetical protein